MGEHNILFCCVLDRLTICVQTAKVAEQQIQEVMCTKLSHTIMRCGQSRCLDRLLSSSFGRVGDGMEAIFFVRGSVATDGGQCEMGGQTQKVRSERSENLRY